MNKEDASSPTVSLKAMMMSCDINVKEGRYVIVTDIPGEFLHTDMKHTIHMVLEGTIGEHAAKLERIIDIKYIWNNKKCKPMLYVQLKKVLHGTLQAALLFGDFYQTC